MHLINAFKRPLNEEALYWLGFLATDGNLSSYGHCISFSLSGEDRIHVCRLKEFLQYGTLFDVQPLHGNIFTKFVLSSVEVYKDLTSFGLTPRKSLTLKISDEVVESGSFWAGCFDGDGCIRKVDDCYFRTSLCSSSVSFIGQYSNFVGTLGILGRLYSVRSRAGNIHYQYSVNSQKDIRVLVKTMYDKVEAISLPRKRRLIQEAIYGTASVSA
jgi:hypothetical protein